MIKISDGPRTYSVRVLRPDVKLTQDRSESGQRERFQKSWERYETRFRRPKHTWTGEDHTIARRLVAKHGVDVLDQYLVDFWLRFSEPLYEGYDHPLRLFASSIPQIVKERNA